jgi:hypothetical protein
MKKILSLLVILGTLHVNAQSVQKNKSYLMPQLGVLSGDQANSFQFQLVGGVTAKNWRIGMGTGLDYYKVRSVPVFADVRHYLGKNKKAFSFVNIGYNVPWPLENQYKIFFIQGASTKSKFDMGWYSDLGLGYDIGLGKQNALSLSLSYSVKAFTETYDERLDWIWGWPITQPAGSASERKVDYTFRRLSLKAGFRLW